MGPVLGQGHGVAPGAGAGFEITARFFGEADGHGVGTVLAHGTLSATRTAEAAWAGTVGAHKWLARRPTMEKHAETKRIRAFQIRGRWAFGAVAAGNERFGTALDDCAIGSDCVRSEKGRRG